MEEENAIIVNDNGDGVLLEEYKGNYFLSATKRGQNDINNKQWVFLSKWQNGRSVPDVKKQVMRVKLGRDPMKILRAIAELLKKTPSQK